MKKHLLPLTFFLVLALVLSACTPKAASEPALAESVYPAGSDARTAYPAAASPTAIPPTTTEIPTFSAPRAFRCFPSGYFRMDRLGLPTGTRPRCTIRSTPA
jgi:hypothetical protein